jgi:hypothetical protein
MTSLHKIAARLGVIAVFVAGSAVAAEPAGAATWHPWENIGSPGDIGFQGAPTIAARDSGAVDIFKKHDFQVWHRGWTPTGGWRSWESIGTPTGEGRDLDFSEPSAVARPGTRVSVVVAVDNLVWHRAWQGSWGSWENLGLPIEGLTSAPAVSTRPDGTVDVWVTDAFLRIQHKLWLPQRGWQPWEIVGFFARSAVAAVGAPDGKVWLAYVGGDLQIKHRVWSPATYLWSQEYDSGAPSTSGGWPGVAIAARPNGIIDLFGHGGLAGTIEHRWRSPAGVWTEWGSLGGSNMTSAPSAVVRPTNGVLDVVAADWHNDVWHRYLS